MQGLAIVAAIVLVLIVGGRLWLKAYLHGPEFQKFVAAKLGETLNAEVECLPFRFDGLTLYCDGVTARGYEGSAFAEARLSQVSARFNLRGVLRGVWLIDRLQSEELSLRLDGTRLSPPPKVTSTSRLESRQHAPGLLPNRLEVVGGDLQSLEIYWGTSADRTGSFQKTGALNFSRVGLNPGHWKGNLKGGELAVAGLPPLSLTELSADYRRDLSKMVVNQASFVGLDGGTAVASGEVRFHEKLDFKAHITGLDLDPLLSEDWRLRLHGKMSGDIRVQSALPATGEPTVTGIIDVSDGRIEALPVLNEIAAITQVQQFRQLPLKRASGAFHRENGRLDVTNLVAESDGRLRIEGGFAVQRNEIDGTFQVGVPPALLQWIPGAQERVFTTARDGYAWTTMRLTGPLDAPTEDLSQRLIAAAGDTVLQKIEESANDVLQRGKEAAKSALELLLPLTK